MLWNGLAPSPLGLNWMLVRVQVYPPPIARQRGPYNLSSLEKSLRGWHPHHVRGPFRAQRAGSNFGLAVSSFNAKSLLEPGKLVFFAKQLEQLDIDIACVQESRFRDTHHLERVQNYHICSAAAEPHRGGLLVLVRERSGLVVLEHEVVSPRVLRVSIRANSLLLHVLAAHAPTEEPLEEEHTAFAAEMITAIKKIKGTDD
eukprot:5981909-Amphidinium_carterae.3